MNTKKAIGMFLILMAIIVGVNVVINGENGASGDWKNYSLSKMNKHIKVLTCDQILENKPITNCRAYLSGTIIDGLQIALIDQNNNGRYDDFGTDVIMFGNSIYALPISSVINVNNKLYDFKIDAEQLKVSLKPYGGTIGQVDLVSEYKGSMSLDLIVLKSNDGNYFDVSKNKAFVLPCGFYSLWVGYFEDKGKHVEIEGTKMEKIEVKNSSTAENKDITRIKWGQPLRFEVETMVKPLKDKTNKIIIPYFPISSIDRGYGLKVFGSAGEGYYNFTPEIGPDIEIKDAQDNLVCKGTFGCST